MIKIEFNNKTNREFALVVQNLTRRKRAEERIERHTVEGRSGQIIDRLGTFESYEREVTFANFEKDKVRDINKWLSGNGILRTSVDPDGFFYADVIDVMERNPLGCCRNSMKVTFLVEPFFYLERGRHPIKTNKSISIYNLGTIYSEPVIKVYGNGSGRLSINNKIINLRNIENYVTIDSKLKITHKDNLPKGKDMTGEYPIFEEGRNYISFSGGITKLEIVPYWREL